jgi:hypothetical protein
MALPACTGLNTESECYDVLLFLQRCTDAEHPATHDHGCWLVFNITISTQAVPAGRSVVSRPDRPTEASRLPLLQPVCYKEGDAESNGEQTENRVIVITSGKGGVGKTTASANLGMSIAR